MPYQPGVQDVSGQLRAAGKVARTEGVASGFSGGFQSYQQNKLRNQILQGENEGLLKAFMEDPDAKKYAPEGIDKFLMKVEKGGGLGLDDNIKLNGMLNSTLKTRGVIAEQKQQQQQMAMQAKQMEMEQAKLAQFNEERKKQLELEAKLRQFVDLGKDPGKFTPDQRARMNTEAYGVPDPMMVEATENGEPPGGNAMLRRAIDAFSATGQIPRAETLINDDTRQQIQQMRDASAAEIAELKAQQAGGYATMDEAIAAAKAAGATNFNTQQNAAGRVLLNASIGSKRTDGPEIKEVDGRKFYRDGDDWRPLQNDFDPMTIAQWNQARALANPADRDQVWGRTYGEWRKMEAEQMKTVDKPAAAAAPKAASAAAAMTSPDQLKAALAAGAITLDQAKAIAQAKGWK